MYVCDTCDVSDMCDDACDIVFHVWHYDCTFILSPQAQAPVLVSCLPMTRMLIDWRLQSRALLHREGG